MQKQQVISTVLSVGTVVTCYQTAYAVYLVSSKNQRYVYESKFRFSTCVCVYDANDTKKKKDPILFKRWGCTSSFGTDLTFCPAYSSSTQKMTLLPSSVGTNVYVVPL